MLYLFAYIPRSRFNWPLIKVSMVFVWWISHDFIEIIYVGLLKEIRKILSIGMSAPPPSQRFQLLNEIEMLFLGRTDQDCRGLVLVRRGENILTDDDRDLHNFIQDEPFCAKQQCNAVWILNIWWRVWQASDYYRVWAQKLWDSCEFTLVTILYCTDFGIAGFLLGLGSTGLHAWVRFGLLSTFSCIISICSQIV